MDDKKIETTENQAEEKPSLLHEVISYAVMVVLAVILAYIINHVLIANAVVPTGSMETIVMPGDRLIINRLSYKFGDPERGDIVMFKFPDDETQDYLKRIIGLPGETVTIIDGLVYIDDATEPLYEPYLKDAPRGTYGPFEVPEGCYFMMGDNRNISDDARYWDNHYVKREKIVGRAVFKYWKGFKVLSRFDYDAE